MSTHDKFGFQSLSELQDKINELQVDVKLTNDISPLSREVVVGHKVAPNAMAILPMEGCDSNLDGSPSELVRRRYLKLASGGAGLIWWEANAVVREGKANSLQMMLTKENLNEFHQLVKDSNTAAANKNGSSHVPVNILQLTHSGRYSKPDGKPAPIIAVHDPILDPRGGITENTPLVTDEYLDSLVEDYVNSALLAKEAGFDGVDIKACHRYLLSELLGAHRRSGRYGGCFENRSRLLLDIVKEVKKATGNDFIVSSRFNVFDAHPYPYGFGCDEKDMWKFNKTEPLDLVGKLCENGVGLLSNSAGNPYYIYPQVTRPFDVSSQGIPIPDEHPLESIARLFDFTRQIQVKAGKVPVVGNGYTWLRQFIPNVGASNLLDGSCSFIGLGRSSFAYPDAVYDIIHNGSMVPNKCCITCSKCTQIMRDNGRTGCVIRDSEIYAPLYQEGRKQGTN